MKQNIISNLRQWKSSSKKFASITAYDFSFARLFFDQGIQTLLVGDSLGMTIQGNDYTLPVTINVFSIILLL